MPRSSRPRHFYLGDRLETVERIRAGTSSVEECARDLQVEPHVIREWLVRHGVDRPTSISEIVQGSERLALEHRVRGLRECLASAEREVVRLHLQLVSALA